MSDAIVVAPSVVDQENVGVLMRRATDVAGVCKDIVTKTAQAIQGRKYVRVEGWQSIAVAYGCIASARDVEAVPGGVRAIGEVRRMSDGAVLATAEGFVGEDEPVWYGGGHNHKTGKPYEARPMYAKRAMAQTRAISRACRSAFAFVVTLIDSNLSTTPAEEMDGLLVEASPQQAPVGVDRLRNQARAAPTPPPPAGPPEPPPHGDAEAPGGAVPTHDRAAFFGFGNSKGVAVGQMDDDSLSFYRSAFKRDLADPSKQQWWAKTKRQLAAVEGELAFRGLPL